MSALPVAVPVPALSLAAAAATVRAWGTALAGRFVGRGGEVRALLVGLVAGHHVLLLGPPGVGKTALSSALAAGLGGVNYFERLLTKFSTPDEVFGPYNLAALEAGRYERLTSGYLPEADVAFLDEIFKANSAILNSLLTALNERRFDNGAGRQDIPLRICVGASNESAEEECEALLDRFLLRRQVAPLHNRADVRAMLAAGASAPVPVVDAAALALVQGAARTVQIPGTVLDLVLDVKDALQTKHAILPSDRRFKQSLDAIRAAAALDGRTVAKAADLRVLADILWTREEDRIPVAEEVALVASPGLDTMRRLHDAIVAAWDDATGKGTAKPATPGAKPPAPKLAESLVKAQQTIRTSLEEARAAIGTGKVDGLDPEVQDLLGNMENFAKEAARAVAKSLGL